jgi:hypothetical protein
MASQGDAGTSRDRLARKLFLLRENTSNLVTAVRTGALVEEIRDCVHQIDLSHQDRNEKSLGRILNSQV